MLTSFPSALLSFPKAKHKKIRVSDGVTVEYPSRQVNEVRESPKAAAQLHQYAEVSYGTSFFASTVMQPQIEPFFPNKVIN